MSKKKKLDGAPLFENNMYLLGVLSFTYFNILVTFHN